jgi:hypothetical protein
VDRPIAGVLDRSARYGISARHVFAAAAFAVPCAIFVGSASWEPSAWDTAELQGVPYILGIAHPTGFPLYTLLGWLFSHLVAIGTVAFRLNLFCALCVSAASLCAYLTALEFEVSPLLAVLGAWWFAVTSIIWTHAIRAEAHDLALVLGTYCVYCAIRFVQRASQKDFLWAVALWGLALATHPVAIWLAPGLVLAYLLARPRPPVRTAVLACAITFCCVLLYLYLPLRSAYVVAHHGDPTLSLPGVNGAIFLNYNDPRTLQGFLAEVTGNQFGAGHAALDAWNPARLQNDLWQWLATLHETYGIFGVVLAVFGLYRLWTVDARACSVLVVLCVAALPFSYSFAAVEGDPDRYRMLSLWLVAVLMPAAGAVRWNSSDLIRYIVVGALMLLWGGETFANNIALFDNRTNLGGRALISESATAVPPGAYVVTPWLDATSLAYGAYVDGTFGGRIVIAGWPGEYAEQYPEWLRHVPAVYVIAEPNTIVPGIKLAHVRYLDGSHELYRVMGKAPLPHVNKQTAGRR